MSRPVERPAGTRLSRVRAFAREQPWEYYAGFALGRVAPLLSLPLISRSLGPGQFGLFEVSLALVVVTTVVFDAGVGTSIVRFAGDERMTWRTLIATGLRIQLAASAVAFVLVVPAQLALAPGAIHPVVLLTITAAFALIEGLAALAGGMLRAQGRNRRFLNLSVLRLLTTATLAGGGATLFGISGALLGVALGGTPFALQAIISKRRTGGRSDPATRHKLQQYGFPLILTSFALWTLSVSDRLFLQYAVTEEQLGQYGANYRIGSVVLTFIAAPVALAWLPVARQAGERASALARTWMLAYSAVSASVISVLLVSGSVIVPRFYGSKFEPDLLVIGLVGAAGWLGGLYPFLATRALLADSTLVLSLAAVPVIVFALLLNTVLIPTLGTDGAAISTLLSYVVLCVSTGAFVRWHRLVPATP